MIGFEEMGLLKEVLTEEEIGIIIKANMINQLVDSRMKIECIDFAVELNKFVINLCADPTCDIDNTTDMALRIFEGMKRLEGYDKFVEVAQEVYDGHGLNYEEVCEISMKTLSKIGEMMD